MIKLQEKLIDTKSDQIAAVHSTVKTEVKSFSGTVKIGSKTTVTKDFIHRAVKSAVSEDQYHKSVLIFGLQDSTEEDLADIVSHVIGHCSVGDN